MDCKTHNNQYRLLLHKADCEFKYKSCAAAYLHLILTNNIIQYIPDANMYILLISLYAYNSNTFIKLNNAKY